MLIAQIPGNMRLTIGNIEEEEARVVERADSFRVWRPRCASSVAEEEHTICVHNLTTLTVVQLLWRRPLTLNPWQLEPRDRSEMINK